jgi:hydrogenase nickel incorporation protein HypA/HybF
MHEMSIAMQLLEQMLEIAGQHEAVRIQEAEVQLGVMREVVPEAMQMAFAAASAGTIAEGAVLRLSEERIVAVCGVCDCLFTPRQTCFLCPQCNQADARIVAGNDIILKSMICQTEAESATTHNASTREGRETITPVQNPGP